jgi:AP-3 complex subunit sigma
VQRIYQLISTRAAGQCNFLDAPELEEFLARGNAEEEKEKLRVVYRSYATLHFVFVVDASESELGILDLIQVRAHTYVGVGFTNPPGIGLRGIPRPRVRECV